MSLLATIGLDRWPTLTESGLRHSDHQETAPTSGFLIAKPFKQEHNTNQRISMAGEELGGEENLYGVNEHSVSELKALIGRTKTLREGAAEIALTATGIGPARVEQIEQVSIPGTPPEAA